MYSVVSGSNLKYISNTQTRSVKSIGSRIFLAQGGRGLEDWGGVCVTVAYASFDGSKEGCKRLRASANEIFSVYLRVTMFFSIFHFWQSLDIAIWSPWQFTHFGSFWQSSSPHPAQTALPLHEFLVCPNFWHWKHLWGLGMYGRVSFFRYPILIFFGLFCPLIVKTLNNCQLTWLKYMLKNLPTEHCHWYGNAISWKAYSEYVSLHRGPRSRYTCPWFFHVEGFLLTVPFQRQKFEDDYVTILWSLMAWCILADASIQTLKESDVKH